MENPNIKIFGSQLIDPQAIEQLKNCVGEDDYGVLTADAHIGYGHPIGGAIAYKDRVSLSGVGFDIACGNKAIKTDIHVSDISELSGVMDEIYKTISFGIGRKNNEKVDDPVIDRIAKLPIKTSKAHKTKLFEIARSQLGTVGSGNHFVDLFKDQNDLLWIGVHFGSRGFGHRITTGFISVAKGNRFEDHASDGGMFSDPILFSLDSPTGQDYMECLEIAGEYAYAGRNWVVNKVLQILGNPEVSYEVHNHHNFAWKEHHFDESFCVVRKGCTPAFPGQTGFIGSNMFDSSFIVEGKKSEASERGLFSTVHGAGRVMSRRKATGKYRFRKNRNGIREKVILKRGLVDFENTIARAKQLGIELRGGGADESPECYKNLKEVIQAQGDTINVLYELFPIGVAMAGSDIYDPYRD